MSESDLGPKPEARTEPGEPEPGGVDAQPAAEDTLAADLPVEVNPAVDDSMTESLSSPEDTSTRATRDDDPAGASDREPDADAAAEREETD